MQKVRLEIPNIHCENCRKTIEETLTEIEGVQAISVDVPDSYVDTTFDPTDVSLDKIENALEGIGYKVIGKTMMTPGQGV